MDEIEITLIGVTVYFKKVVDFAKAKKVVVPICEIIGCKLPTKIEKLDGESFMKASLDGRTIGAHLLKFDRGFLGLDIDYLVAFPEELVGDDIIAAFGTIVKHYRNFIKRAVISIDHIQEPAFSFEYNQGDSFEDILEEQDVGKFAQILEKHSIRGSSRKVGKSK